MKNFGIYAWPAYSTRLGNPYNYLIYHNIEKKGFQVYDFEVNIKNIFQTGFSSKYEILHIHWPTHVLNARSYRLALRRMYTLTLFIRFAKLIGKKIVWTVHNLEPHESNFPQLHKQLNNFLYKHVDGFISMNKSGLEEIKERATNLKHQKFAYIPHPHYINYYPNELSPAQARKALGIAPDKFVFLFFGQIRSYKNVTGLIKTYRDLKEENKFLVIAGNVHEDIEQELKELTAGASDIALYDTFIKDEDIQSFLNCADLVVTPYNKIFNSGSALLNLSFNKPTLAPDLWALAELKELVGSRWVKTYEGKISAKILGKAMHEIIEENTALADPAPDLSLLEPAKIASQTIAFYQELLQQARP